jgi:hypothetical protein
VAIEAGRRTETLAQADDGAKETPHAFEVCGDDRYMVKLHDETVAGCWCRHSAVAPSF